MEQKLVVAHLVNNFAALMKFEGLLSRSQYPASGLPPQLEGRNSHTHMIVLQDAL
jgi:hypothetical protein